MDAARQAIRYAVPGALAAVWFVLGALLIAHARTGEELSELFRRSQTLELGTIIALVVPTGFLLYQIYYIFDGPDNLWGLLVARDRGAEVLRVLRPSTLKLIRSRLRTDVSTAFRTHIRRGPGWRVVEYLTGVRVRRLCSTPVEELEPSDTWRPDDDDVGESHVTACAHRLRNPEKDQLLQVFRRHWYSNWDTVRILVDIQAELEGSKGVKDAYNRLSDVYSALGALKSALVLSAACAITSSFALHWADNAANLRGVAIAVSPYLVATGMISFQLTRNRRAARKSLVRTLQTYLLLNEQAIASRLRVI